VTLPPKAEKLIQRAVVNSIGKRFSAAPDEVKAALDEIDTWEPPMPLFTPPDPDGNQNQD
jgi:hypothetical protein